MSIEEEYQALRSKRGRKSAAQKARLEELEKLMSEGTADEVVEVEETSEVDPLHDFGGEMATIMITHDNLGVPKPDGTIHKVFQFDVMEVPKAFADLAVELERAKVTKDDPTLDLREV